jgi:predicted ATPase
VVSLAAARPRHDARRPRLGGGGASEGSACSGARSWSTPATASGSIPTGRLEEVRLGLLEDQAAARVDLGGGAELLAELEWLLGQYPLREGLWVSFITALYRAGRQADALAAGQRVRRLLVDELGIEPGTALRDLERQILRQSATLDSAPAAAGTATLVVGNLPALSTPLVGRADDLAAVGRLLDGSRLVTLVGPAGVGKTRTVLEAARSLHPAGGGWLVRLEVADAATSILQLVTEALQLTGGEQVLLDRLGGAETVLVLDNCEHVIDSAADLATRLLDRAPPLRILTTSQAPLGVDGETVYAVDPLPLADSVTLFADRAARMRRRFALDDDTTATVEAVCRSLDGLPLAIELAAARVRSLSVQEIARRLDDRFTLLQDPTSRRPERRRALAAAIAWSYDLLFPDDQRGLWALSCFSGGASLAAAEHVLTALGVPGSSAVDVIDRLADRSMLSVETAEDGTTRYRLLDSIRAFAASRLEEAGGSTTPTPPTPPGSRGPPNGAPPPSAAGPSPTAWPWSAPSGPTSTAPWPGPPPTIPSWACAWPTGSAGPGWCSATGSPVPHGCAPRSTRPGTSPPHASRRPACCWPAGWRRPPATSTRPRTTSTAPWPSPNGSATTACAPTPSGTWRSCVSSRDALRTSWSWPAAAWPCTGGSSCPGRPRPACCSAPSGRSVGDTVSATRAATEAVRHLTPIEDSWGLVHAEAMLGAVANAEHRFADADAALTRAAELSERLGFVGQAALHLTTLGRVQQRSGAHDQAAATLARHHRRRPPHRGDRQDPRPRTLRGGDGSRRAPAGGERPVAGHPGATAPCSPLPPGRPVPGAPAPGRRPSGPPRCSTRHGTGRPEGPSPGLDALARRRRPRRPLGAGAAAEATACMRSGTP